MIYSQFALFILRVFNVAQKVALTPSPSTIDHVDRDRLFATFAPDAREHDHDAQAQSRTRMRRIEGDVQIGALFSIHHKKKGSESCGEIWEQYGMHRLEIALKTIEEINADPSILPNVRLGIDIRDDCWTERTAMEETIEFIRESIGSGPACADAKSNESGNKSSNLLLAAVVGPGNSDMSIATHNLLQVFRIPQVGYSATTADLSDKSDFKYYMRLVPSDVYQAQALVDIAIHFKWTYIAVIYSNGNYGEKGFEQMQYYIERADNLCVATSEKIDSLAPAQRFDELLESLAELDPRPRAAICFCEGGTIRRIFEAMKRRRVNKLDNETDFGIQLIGSESWSDRRDVVQGYEDVATGGISLRIYSPRVESFESYYWSLKPHSNFHNPWFIDFWQERFNCSLSQSASHFYTKRCAGDEDLSNGYIQDPKLSQVINSIYTVAYGLDAMYKNVCLGYAGRGLCPSMRKLNGTQLLDYMLNVRFNDSHGQEISFDRNGDPPARYEILSFQGSNYVWAGEWRSIISVNENGTTAYKHNLTVHADKWMWYDGTFAKDSILESICSGHCLPGHVKKIQATKCCWTCVRCLDNEYIIDETACKNCSLGYWPTENRSSCYKLEIEYLRSGSPEAIVMLVLSCVGILATFYTTAIFARFNSTPVVKATTRELSYIILGGCFLCYATTFIIVIQPATATCYALRILPGFAFAMIYGALLTKTNRIARILAGSKKRILTKKPRFLSTRAQVVITWLLVAVELVIVVAILVYEPAKADYDYSMPRRVLLVCQASTLSFLAPFGFDFFLITLCTLYAVKTRNLPENFNEAKFIGFTMYTTCIIWLAFITIYFGSNNKGITMSLSFTLSASVALVLLFFPKLYIILFQPHKNVRSSYATTKVIRCHFGNSHSSTMSHSPHDSHRTTSSGPKTMSTASRPSSKVSARSEIPVSDSGVRFKKTNLRDSIHVAAPQLGSTDQRQSTNLPTAKDPAASSNNAVTASVAPVRPFRSAVYFQNELSVIEESLMSHDDSLQVHRPSSSLCSVDQQPIVCMMNTNSRPSKSASMQTDPDVFEEFLAAWILQRQQEAEWPNVRKRSLSLNRVPSFRRRSDASVGECNFAEDQRENHFEFKRTYTEYRKGSKRIRRQDGSRLKIPRQPSIVSESLVEDGVSEQLAALISRRRSLKPDSSHEENAAFLSQIDSLAPIDAATSTPTEELSRHNTLRRRSKQRLSASGNDGEMIEAKLGDFGSSQHQRQDQQKLRAPASTVTPFGDIMAQTFGGAFQTFLGTAVPVDEKQEFFITTEVIEEADEEEELRQNQQGKERTSVVDQTLESCLDTLGLPGSAEVAALQQSGGDGSDGSAIGGSTVLGSPLRSKFDRKGSLLRRVGNSIRKKIRRLSGDAAAGHLCLQARAIEEHYNARARAFSTTPSRQNSVGEQLATDAEVSTPFIEEQRSVIEVTQSPMGSPSLSSSSQNARRRNQLPFTESMETDSSRQLEKMVSFDEEASGMKHGGSRRGKRNLCQRSRTMVTLPGSTFANTTTIPNAPNLGSDTVPSSLKKNELESLLQSQGLEPVEFTSSTLV